MKNLFKGKFSTMLVVVATVILAGVAIFTAARLYQLRNQGVTPNAPESAPLAWDCSKYTFSVNSAGVVTVDNQSTRDEVLQQAKVFINSSQVATLDVPALPRGQSATLGTVQVPDSGFTWRVQGTRDCQNSGTVAKACELLTFTITVNSPTLTPTLPPNVTATLTVTPTLTPTPASSVTPTEPASGGISSTPTVTPGPSITPTLAPGTTATITPTRTPSNTPTPGGQIAAASPTPSGATLPDAGSGLMTVLAFGFGIALITFALLIAI